MVRTTSLTLLAALAVISGCKGAEGPIGPAGADGPAGPAGPQGEPGTGGGVASISGVFPAMAYTGRTQRVTISGSGTEWATGATVDFGPGITVSNIIVASASGISAEIEIAPDAADGARDVSVTQGGSTVTFAGAFWLNDPLKVTEVLGTQAQGSILIANAKMLDLSTPFDASSFLVGEDGVNFIPQAGDMYNFPGIALVDVDATTGPQAVMAVTGPEGDEIVSMDRDGLNIAARTGLELVPGENVGTIADPFESHLYTFSTPTTPMDIQIDIIGGEYCFDFYGYPICYGTTAFALLPATGSFLDYLDGETDLVFTTDYTFKSEGENTYYLIVWDNYGTSAFEYTLDMTLTPPDGDDTCATGNAITSFPASIPAVLGSAADADWYSIDVAAADVGSTFVVTTAIDAAADTDSILTIYGPNDCTTIIDEADGIPGETIEFTADVAGTYNIEVTVYNTSVGAYTLEVEKQAPPPPAIPEVEDNGVCNDAQALGALPVNVAAELDADDDVDLFSFNVNAANAGSVYRVKSVIDTGVLDTDTMMTIYGPDDCTTVIDDADGFGGETIEFTAATAGKYTIELVPYVGYYGAAIGEYNLEVSKL